MDVLMAITKAERPHLVPFYHFTTAEGKDKVVELVAACTPNMIEDEKTFLLLGNHTKFLVDVREYI